MRHAILFLLLTAFAYGQSDSVVTAVRVTITNGTDTVIVRLPVTLSQRATFQTAYGSAWKERVAQSVIERAGSFDAEGWANIRAAALVDSYAEAVTGKRQAVLRAMRDGRERVTVREIAP